MPADAAQRAALSSKLEQLEYEAKKAFEQYDAVDARNRLAASELERRWNEKLEGDRGSQATTFQSGWKATFVVYLKRKPEYARWVITLPKSGKAITVLRHSRR